MLLFIHNENTFHHSFQNGLEIFLVLGNLSNLLPELVGDLINGPRQITQFIIRADPLNLMIRGQSSNHLGHPSDRIGKIPEHQIGEEADRQESKERRPKPWNLHREIEISINADE